MTIVGEFALLICGRVADSISADFNGDKLYFYSVILDFSDPKDQKYLQSHIR